MNTQQTDFSGKPESGKSQNSQSSSETPPPDGSLASAHPHGQTRKIRQPNPEAGGATGSAPSPEGFPAAYSNHLASLRRAKEQTDKILEEYNPGHGTARGAMEQTWQLLFDFLQRLPLTELSEFNTLASIIHRLCSSFTQIGNLEMKLCEYETERQEREERKQEILDEFKQNQHPNGLSDQTRQDIEQMLKLL